MGTTASLFSVVIPALIVPVQSQLQPDYAQMSYTPTTVASVSLGKIATFIAMSGKQWVNHTPKLRCVDLLSIRVGIDSTRRMEWPPRTSTLS
ncbi:hypothetical protein BDM02DRAFT_3120304 [Thelephora ganbajun]|uniref:Uncharacterized protein n=1 Tax=Thelephora ganbajun TaxID=370292 RepID=A0ACB6Z786_THEGA|nr:hypothetical protein BDM02DRAFT_3120304 [Thelephora ganbajun]